MLKFIATILLPALVLGSGNVVAGTPKLKHLSPNVYRVTGLGVEGIGLSVPRAQANKDLKVTLNKASKNKTVLSAWKDGTLFPLVTLAPGKRTATIPGALVKKSSRLFVATSDSATTVFLVDGDNKKVNKGILKGFFDKNVRVVLKNNTNITIGWHLLWGDDGTSPLRGGDTQVFYNGSDNVTVSADVPINQPNRARTVQFICENFDVGEPRAAISFSNGDRDGSFYSEDESHSYSNNGYKYDIRRNGDTDYKEFVITISKE